MKYGGVYGSVEYSKEDKCFHGKIKGISDLITYEWQTKEELHQNFKIVVDMWHEDRVSLGVCRGGYVDKKTADEFLNSLRNFQP